MCLDHDISDMAHFCKQALCQAKTVRSCNHYILCAMNIMFPLLHFCKLWFSVNLYLLFVKKNTSISCIHFCEKFHHTDNLLMNW